MTAPGADATQAIAQTNVRFPPSADISNRRL